MAVLGPWPHGDPMPLTPHERERLAEIEAGLRGDPEFSVDRPVGVPPARRVRQTVAAAVMLVGIALSVAGAALAPHSFVVGFTIVLTGFITVVGGAVVWFAAAEHRAA